MNSTQKSTILFEEQQYFSQWWLRIINFGILVLTFYGIYTQIFKGIPWGDNPMTDRDLILVCLFTIMIVIMFFSFNLKTKVSSEKISFRFFPFHLKEKSFILSDIQSMEVITYNPLFDYGGWGIRGFGNDRAFNVKGNKGLRIVFKDGKIRLIGTQKPEELQEVITRLGF